MKKLALLLIIPILFTSCASILNSKYQKITINTDSDVEVKIDGRTPKIKKGKYLIKRDLKAKQIVLSKEGYKSQYYTLSQSKKSKLYYGSWLTIGLAAVSTYGILALYVPYADRGPHAFNYEKEYSFKDEMVAIPEKDSTLKEIQLNKFSVDIKAEDLIVNYARSYKNFKKGKYYTTSNNSSTEALKIENTIFSDLLNELLVEKGYIDTTRVLIKDNYLSNLYIDAKITHCVVNSSQVHNDAEHGLTFVDMIIEWKALDYYKEPIFTQTSNVTSGQIAYSSYNGIERSLQSAIKDGIEVSFYDFVNKNEVQKLLKDRTQEIVEAEQQEIKLKKAEKYVSNITESTEASVTVKSEMGHGSGFIISPDGFVITNYHVVANEKKLKVILNNGLEYDTKVIRSSKIHDLALLKIDANNLIAFKVSNSLDIQLATEVYAVGTPTAEDLSQTISKGIISGIRKKEGNSKLIQTDASINAGNSGGALVDKNGLVLGIVTSKLHGFGIEGVAFGIPAYEVFDKLKLSIEDDAKASIEE